MWCMWHHKNCQLELKKTAEILVSAKFITEHKHTSVFDGPSSQGHCGLTEKVELTAVMVLHLETQGSDLASDFLLLHNEHQRQSITILGDLYKLKFNDLFQFFYQVSLTLESLLEYDTV